MNADTLENLKENWKPISIELSSGKVIHVNHPDYFLTSPALKIVLVFNEPQGTRFTIIDMEKIVSVEKEK